MLLKVFDRSGSDELVEAYRRAVLLILEATGCRGFAGDESDWNSFRSSIHSIISQLSAPGVKPSDVLVAGGAAFTAIQEHNRQEVAAARARAVELQAVVGLLTQTMSEISSGSDRSLTRLRDIERRLAKSEEVFDIRELRQQMADCLASVREESTYRRKESDRLLADLRKTVRRGEPARSTTPESAPVPDALPEEPPPAAVEAPVSRLGEALSEAESLAVEDLLEKVAPEKQPLYAAVLVIDHLKTIAARFGELAAAKVAAFCAEQAKSHLRQALYVGVWRGAACVALLDGKSGVESLERSVMNEAQRHQRPMILDIGHREVLVQVSYSKWSVFPLTGHPVSAVLQNMKSFLASAIISA